MEPRIATLLLGDSSPSGSISTLPPLPNSQLRPLLPAPATHRNDIPGVENLAGPRLRPISVRPKSSVPIAEVLNQEAPAAPQQFATTVSHNPAQPQLFSGRLQDILLDPSQERASKRRKVDGQTTPPALPGSENNLLTLPKLPQLPKKTSRRPRIPPLLQGLHQPPPLPPEGRLFPPITGERGGFSKELGDRVGLRSPAAPARNKEKEDHIPGEIAVVLRNSVSQRGEGKGKDRLVDATFYEAANEPNKEIQRPGDTGENSSGKGKTTKRRNKWTNQETQDLLRGVSMFGIGNWKKIVNHPGFDFHQRTAVDLKDRFRTCCPDETGKSRQINSQTTHSRDSNNDLTLATGLQGDEATPATTSVAPDEASSKPKKPRKSRSDKQEKSTEQLAEMGIQEPFARSKRRQRVEFTEKDDENLWKGYKQYGPVWHLIKEDANFGFRHRHPTDLRDRFRIRYAEEYAKAGYKLKTKNTPGPRANEESNQENFEVAPVTANKNTLQEATPIHINSSSTSNLKVHTLSQPLRNSFPTPYEDFSDIISEDDGENRKSPITLSRHIFQWADANPSQAPSMASASTMPTIANLTGDFGMHFLTGADGMHIDPQELRLPVASMQQGVFSVLPAYTPNQQHFGSTIPMNAGPTTVPAPAPGPSSGSMMASASNKQSVSSLLRTPNLPTIVYPHVPMSSARNTMHKLPRPADLLSGVDHDSRQEVQTTGLALDDGLAMGFSLHSHNATLAPLVGGANMNGVGRNLVMLDRERGGLGEDAFGERSLLNSSI
ncbi:hypothetical protein BU24DRAFT_426941 [Aaosphaeria arxii CBS 175.79]|uniref:Myb-like domain-containing protein n=1 Tax=Aaosphaeria arxii CBS 175.79 TaxID=1450172 RepID=A0A6A5XCT1_9PLEO|nr:uncharacterized protein BU24DRAFT_426941 [Aaosphaeria arxii CBS 175.79]KAF2010730.1 hypothetical protein BU24DRAFT_426941 [Aaosphaeria arxii CBS 175.79]